MSSCMVRFVQNLDLCAIFLGRILQVCVLDQQYTGTKLVIYGHVISNIFCSDGKNAPKIV